eukprot:GHVU01058472.1.p1 GENE.GHVU01058472.1~~GHVU01058472.1.p1  ORF type:complete len:156 (-),score=12.24 GHVU01058472.1:1334-1801(-)
MWQGAGGPIPYMAPEVLVGVTDEATGTKKRMMPQPFSDVWGMCCTAVELYTGNHPWIYSGEESIQKQVNKKQKAKQSPEQLENVPHQVRKAVTVGLHYDYTKRPTALQMEQLVGGYRYSFLFAMKNIQFNVDIAVINNYNMCEDQSVIVLGLVIC